LNLGRDAFEKEQLAVTSILFVITADLSRTWPSILITCGVAFVFSYVLLMLFRYAIKYVVWAIYMGIVVLLSIGSVVMLVLAGIENNSNYSFISGGLTLIAFVLAIVLFFFRRRIRLVIQLFKEASRILIDVPLIIVEPLLTFLALGLSSASFLYFAMLIESSGILTMENEENGNFIKATYEKNAVIEAAKIFNYIGFTWFTLFILGCQHFIIASTVCQWFFTRTKEKLDSPIKRAFSHLLNFHLGSVCLGSVLITIVNMLKMMASSKSVSSLM
jgi:solute carrier family 44 (choline transporter-like protein), member 1